MKISALVVAVVLSLCGCGVATPEEEAVSTSQDALIKAPTPTEDPCITECKKITDQPKRDNCIQECIIRNIRG